MTKRTISIEAPTTFNRKSNLEQVLPYDMELLTPMVGGGVKSWEPDFKNPIRSQSIKGHLRFWWRAMQHCKDPTTLREREDALWGSTAEASTVRLAVIPYGTVERKVLFRPDKYVKYEDQPAYVLFPLQGQTEKNQFTIITDLKFRLTINCRKKDREAVENTIKLWVLFGGIGARTRRGCGSITCQQIMEEFSTPEAIKQFIRKFQKEGGLGFSQAPYPHLQNCRFAWHLQQGKGDFKTSWKSFLDQYKLFRQGKGVARNPGKTNNRPGRTRWPEADAIRRITGKTTGAHTPVHPAGNWFPRGAYGLPIQTEFRNEPTDPQGKFMLAPKGDGRDRWPSPMILKVIKLGSGEILHTCLILNQAMPEQLTFTGPDIDHTLLPAEMPLCFEGKNMPANAPLPSGTSPYDAIIDFLNLTEV